MPEKPGCPILCIFKWEFGKYGESAGSSLWSVYLIVYNIWYTNRMFWETLFLVAERTFAYPAIGYRCCLSATHYYIALNLIPQLAGWPRPTNGLRTSSSFLNTRRLDIRCYRSVSAQTYNTYIIYNVNLYIHMYIGARLLWYI